jgi:hypothetical protein
LRGFFAGLSELIHFDTASWWQCVSRQDDKSDYPFFIGAP